MAECPNCENKDYENGKIHLCVTPVLFVESDDPEIISVDQSKGSTVSIGAGSRLSSAIEKIENTDISGLEQKVNNNSEDIDNLDIKVHTNTVSISTLNNKLDNKVDKIPGKGLSSNDYTNEDKAKLSGIEDGAQVNRVNSVNNKDGDIVLDAGDVGAYTKGEVDSLISGVSGSDLESVLDAGNKARVDQSIQIGEDGEDVAYYTNNGLNYIRNGGNTYLSLNPSMGFQNVNEMGRVTSDIGSGFTIENSEGNNRGQYNAGDISLSGSDGNTEYADFSLNLSNGQPSLSGSDNVKEAFVDWLDIANNSTEIIDLKFTPSVGDNEIALPNSLDNSLAVRVYRNGLLQSLGNDYSFSGVSPIYGSVIFIENFEEDEIIRVVAYRNLVNVLPSVKNYSGQVRLNYTGLSVSGFPSASAKQFDFNSVGSVNISSSPTTKWPYGSGQIYADVVDLANNKLIENNKAGQVHHWRIQGTYLNSDSPELHFYLYNPDSGFMVIESKTLPVNTPNNVFTINLTTIADDNSLPSGKGYNLYVSSSQPDADLVVQIDSITRISEAVENENV